MIKKILEYISTVLALASVVMMLAVAAALMMGCVPETKIVRVPATLTRDDRPTLPKVTAKELECITKETYQKLYDRQRLIVEYASGLEAIIDSTKGD